MQPDDRLTAHTGNSILDVQWRDHRRLEKLMDAYEAPGATAEQRGEAVHSLVRESSMHSVGEEQVFYPAIRKLLPDGDLLADRGLVEHQQVKQLLADLQRITPLDPGFHARAQVMMLTCGSTSTTKTATCCPACIRPPPLISSRRWARRWSGSSRSRPSVSTRGHLGATVGGSATSACARLSSTACRGHRPRAPGRASCCCGTPRCCAGRPACRLCSTPALRSWMPRIGGCEAALIGLIFSGCLTCCSRCWMRRSAITPRP